MTSKRPIRALTQIGFLGLPLLLVILFLLVPTVSLQQQSHILYVNTVDPTCQGQSPCYSSIQAAVDAAQAGDTIRIQAGTYQEQVNISGKNNVATATEADRIILEADPAAPVGSVILTGAVSQCTNGYAIRLQQSKYITIRGISIHSAGGQSISLMGGNNQNQAIHIERNRIFQNGSSECSGGITIARGNPNSLILNNEIFSNGRNGISFIDADGGPHHLINNTIHGNAWSGVNVARSHEVHLVNNLITGNGTASGSTGGRFGVKREGSTSPQPAGITLQNNLICGNRLGEIDGPALDATDANNLTPTGTEGPGVTASPGCEVASNVFANLNGPDGQPNTADDDFTLAPTSPAIDRGMDPRTLGLDSAFNPLLEADFSGEGRRPQDGNSSGTPEFDLGALEVAAAQPVLTGINPTSGVHGQTLTLTVAGERLGGATVLTFLKDGTPDPHITVTNLQVNVQGTELQATAAISGLTALGPRLVQVTTPGGTSDATPTAGNTFTVLGQLTLVPDFVTLRVGRQGSITVALSAPAPPGGLTVTLESAGPGIATVTSPLSLLAGATSGPATVTGVAEGTTNLLASAPGFASGLGVVSVTTLPPDPVTVAPALNQTTATPLGPSTEFLYTGPDPIQTGAAPGAIEARRAAVLRGKVVSRDGTPLSGVTMSILQHPEYGTTLSRADGLFDLAVNGGSQLVVRYEKSGYLPAQRPVTPLWQDYAWLPDVVLSPYDSRVTTIDLSAPTPMQVARGNPVTDTDGTRQATLFFPQGTTANLLLPGGGTQPLTTISVRATEYTVGPTGPNGMPAPLPPTSAYTYAVELSADEAVTQGVKVNGRDVLFNRPVSFYVENFLGFPVGGPVPVGYYDNTNAGWVPYDNGRVIKILSITGGLADLDVTGSGTAASPATLASLGITDAERQQVATLYSPGQSLWRVGITHFSTWDCNWGSGPPADAWFPEQGPPTTDKRATCPTRQPGSIIECQNQTLGEAVEIVGTPFRLHYQSDRVPGRRAAATLDIPVSGASIPASLKRIELEILVAGRRFTDRLPAAPNQRYTFTWDGQDAYGRSLYGLHVTTVRVGYVYDAVYTVNAILSRSFGAAAGIVVGNRAREEFTMWQEQHVTLGVAGPDPRAQGLGGWTVDVQHTYDPGGQVLTLGSGGRRSAQDVGTVINSVTTGAFWGLTVDGQGNVFFTSGHQIKKKRPDGTVTVVAGTGVQGYSGDGGPAVNARLNSPYGLSVDGQGNLYFADYNNYRIRKISPDGIITTVAGNGLYGFSGDGGPATSAMLALPWGVTVDGQGNLFIADTDNNRIRKVTPDGIIRTIAGNGTQSYCGDGGPATSACLGWPARVAVDAQGNVFIPDYLSNRIRQVTPDGIIRTVAGLGPFGQGTGGYSGDGGLATAARLNGPLALAVDAQGNVFIPEYFNHRIRMLTAQGTILTVAGVGTPGFSGDGGPATGSQLNFPRAVAVDPQGNLHIADGNNGRIRKLTPVLPGFGDQDFAIPSGDGSELYQFTAFGRHLQTVHALTGATRYRFSYDSEGRLDSLTDGDNKVTQIERDGAGTPTAIVAPDGQRTTLTLEPNGYLATIANPAGETDRFTYAADGLMLTRTTPRNHEYAFVYDALGRLTRHDDPATGFKTLDRTGTGDTYTVTLTTALNRVSAFHVEPLATGGSRQVDTTPEGTQTQLVIGTDGTRTTTGPDGTVTTLKEGPDPRFGMQAPLPSVLTVRLPSGLTSSLTTTRAVTLADPTNLLSLTSQTNTLTLNGRTGTSTYTAATKTLTDTSPAGRQVATTIDAQGRVSREQVTGLEPVAFTYDPRGRLQTLTQGTGGTVRTSTFTYNPQGFLASLTDPLSRTVSFGYDAAGRVTSQTLPDLRVIQTTYDANGNVASITPPSRPAHTFGYTPVDLEDTYTPPDLGIGNVASTYTYNQDRQLAQVLRPDGQTLTLNYEPTGGRLSSLTAPTGQTTFTYHPTTGQVTSIAAPGGVTLGYTYDGSLLTGTTWTGPVAGSVTRSYDTDFRVASESVNGANPITFQYDPDSLLTQAGSLALTRHAQHGLLTGTTLGSVTDAYTYNTFGELSSYQARYSGTPMWDIQYTTRDALGRISQKTESIGGMTDTNGYTYDPAGRLTDVTKNGTNVAHYEYDGNGNRVSVTRPGVGTVSGTYDAQDRLQTYGAITYGYNKNGDLETATSGGETTTYSFDVYGNLRAVTLPNGTQIEYIIDGQNRRIGKKVNDVLTQGFLYGDQLRIVAELDGGGAVVSRFVNGTKVNVPEYMIKGGVTYRMITDHLGSPRLVVDTATGNIIQRIDYDEFGQITLDTNPGFQPFGFAGGLYDQHTKLTRFGARDYDAFTGRWTTKDPTGFGGGDPNLFGYALNDAVNSSDSLGLRLEGVQVRSHETGRSSLTLVNPDNAREVYYFPLNEPAGWGDAMGSFGYGAALPPGEYLLEPRSGSSGRIIPEGYPVYTTPGQPPGTVIAPYGFRRYWIGPHYGWYSEGCPLIDPNLKSKNVREQLREVIQKHQASGGTRVRVVEY